MNIFRHKLIDSPRFRLGLTYFAVIMVMSLIFSGLFYDQSVHEATINLRRQSGAMRNYTYFATPQEIQAIQDSQLDIFKHSLLKRLAMLNISMAFLGVAISAVLAKKSLRPMEESLESQSRFTSDAAHELRTPLTVIKTETEVALRDSKLKLADAKEILESNLEEAVKLENLTSALLRLAHNSSSLDKTSWQKYKLQDIFVATEERVAKEAKARNVAIKIVDTKLIVFGDADQLVELLVILVSNAIKYSGEGSQVELLAKNNSDSRISILVKDNGIGIKSVDIDHIFDRFYRADQSRTKSKVGGYGLGLSIAKSIVDAHGGKITVKSKPNKGSEFCIILNKK